jgi:Ca2+-binding RTX toxin-like protein
MHGGDGNDRLYGREGEDRLFGGTGDDTLDGQAGGDLMVGGEGDDRYFLDAATDLAIESEAAGLDRVYSTVSHELGNHLEYLILRGTQDLYGGGNHVANHLYGNDGANELRGEEGDDYLYGRGGDDRLNGGPGGDVLKGELGGDEMLGGAGNDRLYGREGDDLLLGGPGDDLLEGGAGNDEYRFGRGGGKDRIHNGAGLNGSHDDDLLTFESSVGMDQIWFSRSGDDLLAQILDTPDQVRVKDWYADDSARIDRIAAGNGELIAADRVEQLIAAMAGFNVAGASVTELSTVQREDYSAMVTAYWQAPAAMTS